MNIDLSKLLADVRAAEAKMTPGEWGVSQFNDALVTGGEKDPNRASWSQPLITDGSFSSPIGTFPPPEKRAANAQGIALFRNSILPLCDAVERFESALKAIAEGCSFPDDEVQRAVRDVARAALSGAEPDV